MKRFDIDNPKTGNPFRVPEGYFENLAESVMSKIPQDQDLPEEETTGANVVSLDPQPAKRRFHWIGWSAAAAACIAAAVFFTNLPQKQNLQTAQASTEETAYDDAYRQQVLEYAMVDNNDIYNYLAGE